MSSIHSVVSLQWVEFALSRLLCALVPTRCMIDVGAHHGTSLAPFLHAGWNVHAFEPIEANRRRLSDSFPASERLVIRGEAISSTSGTGMLHLALNLDGTLHEYHHSLEQISDDPWHKKGPVVTVPIMSLDDLVARSELPRQVGFLKIDTEGHDLAVLKGAGCLECDVISVEFWGDAHALGKSPSPADAMIDLLRTRGYESFLVICHEGDATSVFSSSLQQVRADSWDNLFFFKSSALGERITQHADWRFFLEMSGECDQLRGKEKIVRDLDATARERLLGMEHLQAIAAERLQGMEHLQAIAAERLQGMERLQAIVDERLKLIERLHEALARRPAARLTRLQAVKRFLQQITNSDRRNDAA